MNQFFVPATLAAVVVATPAIQPSRISTVLDEVANADPKIEQVSETSTETADVKPETKQYWVGDSLSNNEKITLKYFQDYGITDKVALATILGNINQESMFHPNICEGGARINYKYCHRGGYGLIQWTTSFRYWGLGNFAKVNSCNPSQLTCQLGYLVTEREWKEALWRFKTPNKSISFYMKGAYRWLGWGIYGNRGYYSKQYINKLSLKTITIQPTEDPGK